MNSAVALEEELGCRAERPEGLLSFLVSRAKSASRALTPSVSDVLHGCADAVNQIVRSAIETRTKAEFDREFSESFVKYAALKLAISHFATAVIPRPLREQLIRESICELEADFRDKGVASFGAKVRDQAIFTVWTLRKINDLTTQIIAVPTTGAGKKEDEECCAQFNMSALRAQFSVDCLNMALENEQAVYPEVLEQLVDGLRSMVNAYTWARRGLDIRVPVEEPEIQFSAMDAEDEALVGFSLAEASEWQDGECTADATY